MVCWECLLCTWKSVQYFCSLFAECDAIFLLLFRSFANYETLSPARVTKIQPNKRGPRPIPSLESSAFIWARALAFNKPRRRASERERESVCLSNSAMAKNRNKKKRKADVSMDISEETVADLPQGTPFKSVLYKWYLYYHCYISFCFDCEFLWSF